MAKFNEPQRREDYVKRGNRRNFIALIVVFVLIVASSTPVGKNVMSTLFGNNDSNVSTTVNADEKNKEEKEENSVVTTSDGTNFEVYYFDVGQGDSELVRIPNGENDTYDILIDCGDYEHSDTMLSYLDDLNITYLDAIVLTHPHGDHMGCMANVLRKVNVGTFYMTEVPEELTPTTTAYEKMLDELIIKQIKTETISMGDTLPAPEGCTIECYGPDKSMVSDSLNNYSAILKFTYDGKKFLFMGDAEGKEYRFALKKNDLDCDVLKSGHHGSSDAMSEEMLDETTPEYCVISCGENNDYGHPHREVKQWLKDYSIPYFRTDLVGTIHMTLVDGEIEVETEK